ncbi:rCG60762, isoform CRA_a [Rattus norvegicus]|uniref:RCG60762, isoform CRA_a n=1 Tax=Rattus norvegicus TaxID=10116 RepID=A6JKZ2_RAT|nr:rCG60762, isoform CRA_a [Rattus norvegicus]EDL97358.1 rCG60762, isoform CRA_a [Rattus norvegicus]
MKSACKPHGPPAGARGAPPCAGAAERARARAAPHARAEHRVRPAAQGGAAMGPGQEAVQVRDTADGAQLHRGAHPHPSRSRAGLGGAALRAAGPQSPLPPIPRC